MREWISSGTKVPSIRNLFRFRAARLWERQRKTNTSKGPVMRKLFLVGIALVAMLVPAATASAAPTGEWAKFAKCPTSNPAAEFCFFAETTSGTIQIGAKPVPVVNPVVLQGGLDTEAGF